MNQRPSELRETAALALPMVLVQVGIILLVATGFLVAAELLVPQGTVPRPSHVLQETRNTAARRFVGSSNRPSDSIDGKIPLRKRSP